MKQIILSVMMMVLVGCGKKAPTTKPLTKTVLKAVAEKPTAFEKAAAIKKTSDEAQAKTFTNSLGMKFVSVPGTEVQFCIWETRVKDYAAYAAADDGVVVRLKNPFGDRFKQTDTHPVVMVNWKDAQAFCQWLTKKELAIGKIKTRQKYRLPTDAEWSVAVGLGRRRESRPRKNADGLSKMFTHGGRASLRQKELGITRRA
jgi:formylglycine-generating enzyme required for sulfatase activity